MKKVILALMLAGVVGGASASEFCKTNSDHVWGMYQMIQTNPAYAELIWRG